MVQGQLVLEHMSSRDIARLFKMRGHQGGLRGGVDRTSKRQLSIDPCTKCHYMGTGLLTRVALTPTPFGYAPDVKAKMTQMHPALTKNT